jgi:hypothetical protein
MPYAAYESSHDGRDFSFDGRDQAGGILGKLSPRVPPVVLAETLDELRLKARAHLGEFPDAFLYLVDSENSVYEIMINKKHHEAIEKAWRYVGISIALLIFCLTCLFCSARGDLAVWGILCFGGISILYFGVVKLGFFNEIEGAVVCEIILILVLILVPAITRLNLSH